MVPLQQPPVQDVESHTQLPAEQRCPAAHFVVQDPQWLASEFRSTQSGSHRVVYGAEEQADPQVLLAHVATLCAPETVQSEGAQQDGGAMLMQVLLPEHVCCPLGHVPLHAAFCAMHTPLQFCGRLVGQAGTHAVPLQVTLPFVGALQAVVHSVRPQVARSLLLTQAPLQL